MNLRYLYIAHNVYDNEAGTVIIIIGTRRMDHRINTTSKQEEEDLLHKWFFSPKRLTPVEITKLKAIVNRPSSSIRPFLKDLINNL